MNGPFPGTDLWLEQHWGDIHHRLITYACDQIQPDLPGDLLARVEERVFVEYENGRGRAVYPDVRVVETGGPHHPMAVPVGGGGIRWRWKRMRSR